MSFVCKLCGDYTDGLVKEVSMTPGLARKNVRVDRNTRMCRDCWRSAKDAESSDEKSGFCPVCEGDSDLMRLYDVGPHGRILDEGIICDDCFRLGRDEYPRDFSSQLKETVRENSSQECAECGMPQDDHEQEFGQKLHVHHRDGDKRNNKTQNLVALCARCHGSK